MISGLAELDNLETIDEKGRPPVGSRLKKAQDARNLYMDMVRDDEGSAANRAMTQGMKDGDPPFDQAKLNASGQGARSNANFLAGHVLISNACNGFIDIVTSVPKLVTIQTEFGEAQERTRNNDIIAAEATRTLRKWGSFMPNFIRITDLFVTHGVGIAFFPTTNNFRFDVAGFGDFLIPRQTPASEEKITYAIARKDTMVTDLYAAIENPEMATKAGWNVPAVRDAIHKATTKSSQGEAGEYERFQQQIKNNDLQTNRNFPHVPVLHIYVREFDGSYSYFQCEKDGSGEFLFAHPSKYKNVEEAFIFFCYGVGNGTYHSIRGLGNLIFALVQLQNRLMCQFSDGAMLGSAMMIQPESAKAMEEFALQYYGPYAVISPGVEIKERQVPNLTQSSIPMLQEVKAQLDRNASQFRAPEGGGAYQNQTNVEQQLDAVSQGDSGAVDLFYASWDRAIRESVRRLITGPKTDPLVKEFHARLEKQGITKEVLDSVDHDSTYAYRALGAGNPAARSVGFSRLLQLLPNLDEIGRKNLIYQFVADIVGYQNADQFASLPDQDRLGDAAKLAEIENKLMMMGIPMEVRSDEMHGTHALIHAPAFIEILEKIEVGEMDPMENIDGLMASLDHLSQHTEQLAQDPTQRVLFGQLRETVNNLGQVVGNMQRKIRSERRKMEAQQQQQPAEGAEAPAQDPKVRLAELQVATAELKYQLTQAKGEIEVATLQAKSQQSLALTDLKAADMAQKQLAFPSTNYQQRR
jgi:hypothetical protein